MKELICCLKIMLEVPQLVRYSLYTINNKWCNLGESLQRIAIPIKIMTKIKKER